MKRYLFKNKFMAIMYIIAVPMACFFSVKFALSFQPIMDSVIRGDIEAFKEAALYSGVYAGLDCLFFLLTRLARENILRDASVGLKRDIFNNVINMEVADFSRNNTGGYISIMDNDVEIIGNNYFGNILSTYSVSVSFLFSFITVLMLNYIITAVLLLIAGLSILIPKFMGKKLGEIQGRYSEHMESYTSKIKDFYEGFQVIRSFNVQEKMIKQHDSINRDREYAGCSSRKKIFFAGWISMVFSSAMYVATFALGGYFTLTGTMSVGLVVSLSQLIGGVVAPLERVPAMLSAIYSTSKVREKIEDILNSGSWDKSFKEVKHCSGDITLESLRFRYPNTEKDVLHGVNMKFQFGKKYAIVGASGSGKSTIAKIIAGFYRSEQGSMMLGDEDIKAMYGTKNIPSVGYMPQSTFLFHDTLRNNITLYEEYTDEDIQWAIDKSGLRSVVDRLENGMDSDVGEGGNQFSGGERQRIGLARTILRKNSFMIFDEATSSLDNITSKDIFNTIMEMENTTPIMITHQLDKSILQRCSCIYVMKDGEVVHSGTLDEICEEGTYFSELYIGSSKHS